MVNVCWASGSLPLTRYWVKIINNAGNATRPFLFISWPDARLKTVLADLHRPSEVASEAINESDTNPVWLAISFALQCWCRERHLNFVRWSLASSHLKLLCWDHWADKPYKAAGVTWVAAHASSIYKLSSAWWLLDWQAPQAWQQQYTGSSCARAASCPATKKQQDQPQCAFYVSR